MATVDERTATLPPELPHELADLWLRTPDLVGRLDLVGRNRAPRVLERLWLSGAITQDELLDVLVDVWQGIEFPTQALPQALWLRWFRLGTFPRPSEPVALWRGADARHARGMSWTRDRDQAAWFAKRWSSPVWEALVPPEAILVDVDAALPDGRGEHELVVDPAMLPRLRRVA